MVKNKRIYFIFLAFLLCFLCACGEEENSNGKGRRENDGVVTETPTPTIETEPISPTNQVSAAPTDTPLLPTETVSPTAVPLPTQEISKEDMLSTHIQSMCEYSTSMPRVEYNGEKSFINWLDKGTNTLPKSEAWGYSSSPELLGSFFGTYFEETLRFNGSPERITELQDHYLLAATFDWTGHGDQRVVLCCVSFSDAESAEEIYKMIAEKCFEETDKYPRTRYFCNPDGTRALVCDREDYYVELVCIKGNEVVISETVGKTALAEYINIACGIPSPFGTDGGDMMECDAEKVIGILYSNFWGHDCKQAFDLIYPQDKILETTAKAKRKLGIRKNDFNLYDYFEDQFNKSYGGRFNTIDSAVCENAYNPVKTNQLLNGNISPQAKEYQDYTLPEDWHFADKGSAVYVAVINWGYMKEDLDLEAFLEEHDGRYPDISDMDVLGRDVLWVYRHNGRWFVTGNPYGIETYETLIE